ncbi:hypothetical protein HDE_09837 [Halotydeus destructor]|nr:hypothetical protein HDE_09837 [Halotydeus destructor]
MLKAITLVLVAAIVVRPLDSAKVGKWSVSDPASGVICILAEFSASFQFDRVVNGTQREAIFVDVPTTAVVNPNANGCRDNLLPLTFGNNSFTVTFAQDSSSKYHVNGIAISYEYGIQDGVTQVVSAILDSDNLFATDSNHSYHCAPETTLKSFNETDFVLTLSNVKFEAFRTSKSAKFEWPAIDCENKEPSFWVNNIVVVAAVFVTAIICTGLLIYIFRMTCCYDCCHEYIAVDL